MSAEEIFLGESTHTVDAKNRVFVPKRFQDVLPYNKQGSRVVYLAVGFEQCLFLFSESGFQAALARLKTQPFGGEELRRIQRLFFGRAHKTGLDGSGRVVLPEKLRKLAGLTKEVTMVGVGERAELWDSQAWISFEEEAQTDYDVLDRILSGDGPQASAPEQNGSEQGGGQA